MELTQLVKFYTAMFLLGEGNEGGLMD